MKQEARPCFSPRRYLLTKVKPIIELTVEETRKSTLVVRRRVSIYQQERIVVPNIGKRFEYKLGK